MTTLTATADASGAPRLIAPLWHTALLVALFLALALGGALFQHHAQAAPGVLQQHPNAVPLYLSLIAMEWGLVRYVYKGTRGAGIGLGELIGGDWSRVSRIFADLALGLAGWGIWTLLQLGWTRWFGIGHAAPIDTLLPRGALESVLWIAVSISAGFCEELVFRGYLQQQFTGLMRSRALALLLQAALFGISHGYEGVDSCLRIALFGMGFSLLALWRRSLRAGMLGHAWTDIASGLFGI